MHTILRLDGLHSCAIIEFEAGRIPLWRHFGAQLQATALLNQWSAPATKRLSPASMDRLDGIPLLPSFGNGAPHTPALRVHRDGLFAVQEMVAQSYNLNESALGQTLALKLRDATTQSAANLEATITLTLYRDSDVLSIKTVLRNAGEQLLQIDQLAAATVAIPAHLQDVASFSGQWAHEFQWNRTPAPMSGWRIENRHGRTSHESPPACFLLSPQADDHAGDVIAAHLAWSGNHYFSVNHHDDGSLMLQAGEWLAPGEVRLESGGEIETPELLVTWSGQGLNGASGNLHRFARQHVLNGPGGVLPVRPVHLNTWEAVYFDHDDAVLRELANQAAAIGVERFVLDDGWFPGRPNDRSGLGDWWPDPAKYPNGLGPLIAHVRGLGMGFGLWVEPEMVNPDSELFRNHPDWALQTQGRALELGRQQLVLDIARAEVSDYLFGKLDDLLAHNDISYLKWDMNRHFAQADNVQGRMAYRQQIHALYELLARVRKAYPGVEIESCASGGGRMDLGVLRHTQRFWTSDNNDALSRIRIQSGAARLFPLEVLGAHVGPAPAHSTGRSQSMDFRCAVACFGHMGVEADVRMLGADDRAKLGRWIALHKQWRGVLHTGAYHQGRSANGVWWMVQTANRCLLGVFTVHAPSFNHHAPLRIPSLAGTGVWSVRLVGMAGQERARGQEPALWRDALQASGVQCTADELSVLGLPVPNMNPESALVFALERVQPSNPDGVV